MYRRFWFLAASLAAIVLLAAGCSGGGGPVETAVTMKEFAFEPDRLTVPVGADVSLTITNLGALEHNFIVMNAGSEVEGAWSDSDHANSFFEQNQTPAGETVAVSFTAPSQPGEYQFLCSVPAHFEQGMHGVLKVTE